MQDVQQQIAKDLGIDGLSPEEQAVLISDFGALALKAATVAILEKLSEEKRAEFAALADAGDPGKLKVFLDGELPDHDAIAKATVAEEVRKFKEFQAAQ